MHEDDLETVQVTVWRPSAGVYRLLDSLVAEIRNGAQVVAQ